MSLSSDVIDRLPHVEGLHNYLAPMAAKPMNLAYDPPTGVPRSSGIPEPHFMRIHDARPVAGRLTLDGEGLAIVEHRSAVEDLYDEDERKEQPIGGGDRRFNATAGSGMPSAASRSTS